MDPDRSRGANLVVPGEDSLESGGDGVWFLVRECARSTTDGDLDGSRTLGFRTEKNEDDGRSARGWPSPAPPPLADSFSNALIRCDMLEPMFAFLGAKLLGEGCCVSLCRNAAPKILLSPSWSR